MALARSNCAERSNSARAFASLASAARTCASSRSRSSGRSPARKRLEARPGLVELALQGLQPGLEFVLPQLGDHLALGDLLPFLNGQLDQQAGHLEGQLDLFRGFDLPGKRAHMQSPPRPSRPSF